MRKAKLVCEILNLKLRFFSCLSRKIAFQNPNLIVTSNQPPVYWYFIDGYSKRTHKSIFHAPIYRFFFMFLHEKFLQFMFLPLKLSKNSLGL